MTGLWIPFTALAIGALALIFLIVMLYLRHIGRI
jgi:hypothetical protein